MFSCFCSFSDESGPLFGGLWLRLKGAIALRRMRGFKESFAHFPKTFNNLFLLTPGDSCVTAGLMKALLETWLSRERVGRLGALIVKIGILFKEGKKTCVATSLRTQGEVQTWMRDQEVCHAGWAAEKRWQGAPGVW